MISRKLVVKKNSLMGKFCSSLSRQTYSKCKMKEEKKSRNEKLISFLKAIDIFDKFDNDDFVSRTKMGAVFSILLMILGVAYLVTKTYRFITPKIIRDLAVNAALVNEQDFVNISVNVLVNLPCYFLHLDAVDSLGFSQLDINSTAKLRRIKKNGKFIGIANETLKDRCYPCFGALPDSVCCNSCEQLILIHHMRGMEPHPDQWPQCQSENRKYKVYLDEKCHIKGKISVNKVSGNFHIAPGRNAVSSGGDHKHDLSYNFPNLDLSHSIEHIRFGPKIPTANNPLENYKVVQNPNSPMVYKYELMVTPVIYVKGGKIADRGYEYTAMITQNDMRNGIREAPGIFFRYQFTPYTITITQKPRSIAMFITSAIGFLSGGFSLTFLADRFVFKAIQIKKESEKKKEEEVVPVNLAK